MDKLTKNQRSKNMSQIKSINTKPEIAVRKLLWQRSYRYRLHVKNLPGKPDILLTKYKTAIFVNGCFWHQHKDCKDANLPKSNIDYWKSKLGNNKKRDIKNYKKISELGYSRLIIWECELTIKNGKLVNTDKLVSRLINFIKLNEKTQGN